MTEFMMLMYGYETPTPSLISQWNAWFAENKDSIVGQGGFSEGIEISSDGEVPLPLSLDAITGYFVLKANSMDDAMSIARTNPYISSIQVYELF